MRQFRFCGDPADFNGTKGEIAKMQSIFPKMKHGLCAALALGLAVAFNPAPVLAQAGGVTGSIEPAIWIDPDGCMHWVADGGVEGYMTTRINPENGMPVCMQGNTCAVANTDTLFHTDSHRLMPGAHAHLQQFFQSEGAFAYAIYGHTDSRASDEYNMRLSQRRAATVAGVARASGARVAREIGYGERRPVAPNTSAANMQQNRRVEIVCYR